MLNSSGNLRPTNHYNAAIDGAREEAIHFDHYYIGTEHLVLGLTRSNDSTAVKVLLARQTPAEKIRNAVEFIIGPGERPLRVEPNFTPRARRVNEYAIDEARRLGHSHLGTEHILLGLIREGEGIAAGVLESLGLRLDEVREEVVKVLKAQDNVPED